ncbi:MAG: hypothetical protein HY371_19740 [Devosia nanyangense]|nr:hypothetical protein [Devosia nanyangense]
MEVELGTEGGKLRFEQVETNSEFTRLLVRLDDGGFSGSTDICEGGGMRPTLAPFFEELARNWLGWPGVLEWEDIDHHLKLRAKHDGTGRVLMTVSLRPDFREFDRELRGGIVLDAGQLDAIAAELRKLLPQGQELLIGAGTAKLIFASPTLEDDTTVVTVTYLNGTASGATSIWDELYCIPPGGRPHEFFRAMADDWRGWEGERVWRDASGNSVWRASNDGISRVTLAVELLLRGDTPVELKLSGGLYVELGQLSHIADRLEKLFDRPDWVNLGPNAKRS